MAADIDGVFVAADVADEEQVAAAVGAAEELASLRLLVNCARIGRAARVDREGVSYKLSMFELVVRVNLTGTFNCIRLDAAAMAKTEPSADGERGAVVKCASVAAFDGQVGQVADSESKGGIVGMTLPIARDLASLGIRVNTIASGLFDTPIYGKGEKADAFREQVGKSVVFPAPLRRGEEFASTAVELLANDYVNGEVVRLDGAVRLPPR